MIDTVSGRIVNAHETKVQYDSSVDTPEIAGDVIEAIYGIDGTPYSQLRPGVNIIKMKSGAVHKLFHQED